MRKVKDEQLKNEVLGAIAKLNSARDYLIGLSAMVKQKGLDCKLKLKKNGRMKNFTKLAEEANDMGAMVIDWYIKHEDNIYFPHEENEQ